MIFQAIVTIFILHYRKMSGAASIGLDLGAGKCCVASVRAGAVTVLPNAHGDKTTPSFVAFTDSRSLVGSDARDQAALNATNTVYGVKTILGRSFRDPVVQNYASYSPVKVVDDGGKPVMEVEYRSGRVHVAPELVAAMQLLKMRQEAEVQVGDIGGAVVAVPASYSNTQREALVAACQIAGLPLLDLISETTATALAYWHNRGPSVAQQTILVFDMGATKLDVSVIKICEKEITILAVCGSDLFCGNYLDQKLMEDLNDKFYDIHKIRLLDHPKATMRLKLACEELKMKLTLLKSNRIQIDNFIGDLDLDFVVTRRQFEKHIADHSIINTILNSVLQDAGLSTKDVDEVVVTGGSTRVPSVQLSLKKYFNGRRLNKTVNADESVACGAAVLAHMLSGNKHMFQLSDIIQYPSLMPLKKNGFHRYTKPCSKMKITKRRKIGNRVIEEIERSYINKPFGIYIQAEIQSQESPGSALNYQANISESSDQLKIFEQHLRDAEALDEITNELHEYCANLKRELSDIMHCIRVRPHGNRKGGGTDSNAYMGLVQRLVDDCQGVLNWLDDYGDEASIEECLTKKQNLMNTRKRVLEIREMKMKNKSGEDHSSAKSSKKKVTPMSVEKDKLPNGEQMNGEVDKKTKLNKNKSSVEEEKSKMKGEELLKKEVLLAGEKLMSRVKENVLEVKEKESDEKERSLEEKEEETEEKVKKPEVKEEEPEEKEKKPEVVNAEPEMDGKKPEVVNVEPEMKEKKPEVANVEPEMKEKKPKVANAEPEMKEKKPKVVNAEPEMKEKKPKVVNAEPEIKEKKPELEGKMPQKIEEGSGVLQVNESVIEVEEEKPEIKSGVRGATNLQKLWSGQLMGA
ncbi:hypothetical protein HAZT_HAZT004025 [Hyalella azteca]|uniref:Uncharacterized protein n=1 Tax=Hyalella azteca TaxID=294128 RepID=A0A6A0HDF5_HYAAZ|nr:hypothetical protein HAZT_HAZT004025 [Hyalella azteca]